MEIRVQSQPFDAGAELNQFTSAQSSVGAIVSFSGIVRNNSACDLRAMEIEHYPAMTEKAITAIAQQAQDRWDLADVLVIHRFGLLHLDDPIMMVATAARHRVAAFAAAEFLMDYLKSRAPFWKKEHGGHAEWVAAQQSDEDALQRW